MTIAFPHNIILHQRCFHSVYSPYIPRIFSSLMNTEKLRNINDFDRALIRFYHGFKRKRYWFATYLPKQAMLLCLQEYLIKA